MRTLFHICLICLAFFGCSKDAEPKLKGIDSDIVIRLQEQLTTAGPWLQILSRTAEVQECYNFKIATSCEKAGDQIKIIYKGIYSPDIICATAMGPATSEPSFPVDHGTYYLTFINENISNTAVLTSDEEKYVLEIQQTENILVEMDTLMKIPEYTYWATVYSNDPVEQAAENFTERLIKLGVNFRTFKDGDYGHFIISGGEIVSVMPYGYDESHKKTIFEFSGSVLEIEKLVRSFIESYDQVLSVSVYNYQGNIINSWELN